MDDLSPQRFPERSQVEVWRDRQVTLLHGVALDSATLYGVPYTLPPNCDSCRVNLPLTAVDSLRVGNKERGFFRSVGLMLAISLAWAITFQGVGGD